MRGIKPHRIVFFVLVLASWMRAGAGQEQVNGEPSAPPHQGGWVIELGDESQAQTDTEASAGSGSQTGQPASHSSGGAGVEMIVGGQGSGGVAKKGTLPVID